MATLGPSYFTSTVTQDVVSGAPTWVNPANARVNDGSYARVTGNGASSSTDLLFKLSDLGLPADGTITGITVTARIRQSVVTDKLRIDFSPGDGATFFGGDASTYFSYSGANTWNTSVLGPDTLGLVGSQLTTNYWNTGTVYLDIFAEPSTGTHDVDWVQITVVYTASGESASVSFTMPKPTVAINTALAPTASVSLTLPKPTIAVTTTASSTAALSLTMPKPVISASASNGNGAALAISMPKPTIAVSTTATSTADVSITMPIPMVSVSATSGELTYVNITMPAFVLGADVTNHYVEPAYAPYIKPVVPSLNLIYQPQQYGATFGACDISFNSGTELESAVLASLLTWGRASKEEVPVNETRHGWWADNLTVSNIGSKLWLLQREKTLPTLKGRAKQYVQEALQWIIDFGIASTIDVVTDITRDGTGLKIDITIYKNDGTIIKMSYDNLWSKQFS